MKFTAAIASLGLLLTACAGPRPAPDSPASTVHSDTAPRTSVEAKQIASEQNAAAVVEISFAKQSAKLSAPAQKNLVQFLEHSKSPTALAEIKTIAWGDSEYPSPSTKKLSQRDTQLAESRNGAIADFLKSKGVAVKVTAYDMTKRPTMFSDWVSTSDARIKKSLEEAGIPNTDTSVKMPAKAGKAMVLAIFKN